MGSLRVGDEHSSDPQVAVAEDQVGTVLVRLTCQGHGEARELLNEVLAASLLGRAHGNTGRRYYGSLSIWHKKYPHRIKDVEVPHRIDSTMSWHTTRVTARATSSGQNIAASLCFNTKVSYMLRLPTADQMHKDLLLCYGC